MMINTFTNITSLLDIAYSDLKSMHSLIKQYVDLRLLESLSKARILVKVSRVAYVQI